MKERSLCAKGKINFATFASSSNLWHASRLRIIETIFFPQLRVMMQPTLIAISTLCHYILCVFIFFRYHFLSLEFRAFYHVNFFPDQVHSIFPCSLRFFRCCQQVVAPIKLHNFTIYTYAAIFQTFSFLKSSFFDDFSIFLEISINKFKKNRIFIRFLP